MFTTKKAFVEGFTEILRGHLEEYVEDQQTRSGWLKTQIFEVDRHLGEPNTTALIDTLQGILSVEPSTIEDDLLYFRNNSQDMDSVYVDLSEPRFPVVYTFMRSKEFDPLVDSLTRTVGIDQIWLPQEVLNSIFAFGAFKGYGGKFDNGFFLDARTKREMEDLPEYTSSSFKSWGNSDKILRLIQGNRDASQEFTLTSARIKYLLTVDREVNDSIIDDINFSGKLTSIGNSFKAHLDVVDRLKGEYKEIITARLEDKFSLRYKDNSILGSKITFTLPVPLDDVGSFVAKLSSSKDPFKLWGLAMEVSDDFVELVAVDLHVKQRIFLYIYKDHIDLYFEEDSCANTVMRLLTLLQQNYNSKVGIIDKDGVIISLEATNG